MMYKEEAKFRESASESNDAMDGAVVDVASAREWFLEVDAPEHAWTESCTSANLSSALVVE
jgi:hypothetical protein